MDNHSWRPSPAPQVGGGGGGALGPGVGGVGGDASGPDSVDWRSDLSAESRDRIVSKIMETLKKHLPVSGPEGLGELKKIAVRFEEKIYHVASNQPDYLRRISLKMLTMETKSQNTIPNAMPSNSNVSINKPSDTVAAVNQPQMLNPGQQMPSQLPGSQSQTRQQLQVQNMQNNAPSGAGQVSGSLSSTLPPVSGLNQSNLPTVVGQNSNLVVSQNSLGNPVGQGLNPNLIVNPQRQMSARQSLAPQQQPQQQPQASQNTQQYIFQQQLQHQLMKQKFQQQGNIPHSLVSSHLPQQPQQSILQPTQLQPTPQSVLQTSVMQPAAVQSATISGPQQSQQTSVHQPAQSMLQHQVLRHHQQPQQQPQAVHHQQTALSQQPMQTSHPPQHHQLTSQPPLQQSQLISQQNTMGDLQQQPQQQHQSRLLNQQSNLPNLQQQLMSQQNNLSNVHQQALAPQTNISGLHQQQQLLGTQPGSSGMQVGQHSVHLLGQSKSQTQQQMQGGGPSLLTSQGQKSQPTAVQQQLMSQMQPPTQHQTQVGLQQTMGLQQQANQLQREQRLQAPNSLLQQQNIIDQQKQLYQSQRTLTESSSVSVDTTSQAGNANGGDWREETYQKLQGMKESYMPDLNEMYQKVMLKLQQHDSLQQQPKSEQTDKLKLFKTMLERIMTFLQVPKSDISMTFKDKLASYEKQIMGVLTTHRPRKSASGQLPPHHMQSVQQQQSQPQIAQMQSHENQMNPQLPQMNIQGSVPTMQQNNVSNLQHNSLSSTSGVSGAQQNMMNSLQVNSAMESGQGNAIGSLTQVALGSMPQNPVSAPHQVNMGTISHQSGVNMSQSNVSSLQQNSNMIQHQHLKQQQEQQMMQTQQMQQRQMQQRQMQQRHMQQHLLHQQLQQQAKQQQHLPGQLQAHQMGQLHQMSDGNDVKMRQGMGVKQGVFPSANQRPNYAHQQQLKQGTSFPSSSPQLLQTASPQIPQHSSPQIDQQNMLLSLTKAGTPLQSANSPFVVPSPSTPLAPSPMPGDLEKPIPAASSLSNVGNVSLQATSTPSLIVAPSLAIGTPGISASPLLAEFSCPDGAHGNSITGVSCKSTMTEQPIERLMRTVKALSSQALSAGVNDIRSVVSMVDRIAGSAPGNGSRAAVGEDLVAMTKCRLQAKNFTTQDGAAGGRKMKRYTSAMPSSVVSSAGSGENGFLQFVGMESADLESTATSTFKRPRAEVNHALLEEIRYINQRLIDTVVDIRDEEVDPGAAAAVAEGGEGVIVECSYNAVSLSPDFKTHYESAQMSRIQPLRLLVPANYPHCSPLLLDKLPVEVSKEYRDLSAKTKARFSISLRNLSQPMSLKEIARTWDKCARGVILEYAQQQGGGSFGSKYGTWESCMTAA